MVELGALEFTGGVAMRVDMDHAERAGPRPSAFRIGRVIE